MLDFSETLDIILEESQNPWQPLNRAMELVRKLDIAKQMVLDLQHQLMSMKNKVNADLALNIRRKMPSLNVGLDKNGSCKVGYKSKHLIFSPDIEKGIWCVQSSDDRFANRFQKLKRHDLIIGADATPLINAIVGYFTSHYKSLDEELTGIGVILVEGRISTMADLVRWREGYTEKKLLNSRAVRQQCLVNA